MVSGLRIADDGAVRTLTLDRPEVLNALTVPLRQGLAAALVEADADPAVRVVLITGAGTAFCSGGDVEEMDTDRTPTQAHEYTSTIANLVFRTLRGMSTPTVARVSGVAAGAGMFLALACDVVVAAEEARFVASHLGIGLPPDWGGLWTVPRLVGQARARALLLTARPIDARRATEWGLIAECVPAAELDATVASYCKALAAAPPGAMAAARDGIARSYDMPLDEFLDWEAKAVAEALLDPEHRRRVQAFLERRRSREQ
jgi:2-(1,2-epoxy-1,2-dihydrophenyl)acetyl-CoA isomerase